LRENGNGDGIDLLPVWSFSLENRVKDVERRDPKRIGEIQGWELDPHFYEEKVRASTSV
jgi:hypothetical protein